MSQRAMRGPSAFTLIEPLDCARGRLPALRERKRGAFTLIELLVVIAIITLLVSILVPTLREAKRLASDTLCMTNLHHCHIALAFYANELDAYPPHWFHGDGQFWHGATPMWSDDTEWLQDGEIAPGVAVGAACYLIKERYLLGGYHYDNWAYPNRNSSKVAMCTEFFRIGVPSGTAVWYSGAGYVYFGGPGSCNHGTMDNFEPEYSQLNIPRSEYFHADGRAGVTADNEASRPLLTCDSAGNWSDRLYMAHQGYAAPANYIVLLGPDCGYRNYLMTDGSIVRYYGIKGL